MPCFAPSFLTSFLVPSPRVEKQKDACLQILACGLHERPVFASPALELIWGKAARSHGRRWWTAAFVKCEGAAAMQVSGARKLQRHI